MSQNQARRPGELLFAALAVSFSLFLAWHAWRIAGFASLSSAGVFPMFATGTMVVSGIVIVLEALRRRPESGALARFAAEVTPIRFLAFTALIAAYMVALVPVGFLISSFVFLFLGMMLLYRGSMLTRLIVSALSLAVIYIVFREIFGVVLPSGRIF